MQCEYPLETLKELIHYQNTHANAYGQEFHCCYGKLPKVASQEAKDCYLDFVCCCNISQNAITGKYFQQLMVAVHADFTTPSEPVFKEMLKNYALRIQEHTLTSLKGEVVSILIDGAKKCTREFEGVILYSHIGLKFLTCQQVQL